MLPPHRILYPVPAEPIVTYCDHLQNPQTRARRWQDAQGDKMKIMTPRRPSSRASVSVALTILAVLAGSTRAAGAEKSPHPQLHARTLAAAKVHLCNGFAEKSVEYYMQTRMPKEYAVYASVRANEFEVTKQESLRSIALQQMQGEAVAEFDPIAVYEVANGRLGRSLRPRADDSDAARYISPPRLN
jgi:hypothetical protein